MTTKTLRATAATAALLIAASLGGQAFAQSYGGDHDRSGQSGQGGYHQGGDYGRGPDAPGGYDRDFGDRSFNDRDFDQRGRFYYGGDTRQRMERIEQWARFSARSGRLERWEARRVFGMLDSIRQQARWMGRDGMVSPRERMVLNSRLDEVVRYVRIHQDRGGGGRRY